MTQVVTVRTDFADLNQMAQGLVGRVNETHVILPADSPVDVGEWAQFAVTLLDGSPGLAGMGRCVTFVDNGQDRQAHQRFDVVFDSLQFDPRGQQIYSHILTLSGYEGEDGEAGDDDGEQREDAGEDVGDDEYAAADGAQSVDDLAYSDVPPAADYAGNDESDDDNGEATVIAERADLQAVMTATIPAAAPRESDVADLADVEDAVMGVGDEQDIADASTQAATRVVSTLSTPPTNGAAHGLSHGAGTYFDASVGYTIDPVGDDAFRYANGLPFPSAPPRPPLAQGQVVSPAPKPGRA